MSCGARLRRWKRVNALFCSPHAVVTRHAEDEEEEEEESETEEEKATPSRPEGSAAAPGPGAETPSGLVTPSGYHSVVSTVPGGLETPDFLDLRKNTRADSEDVPSGPRELYQVIPERETSAKGFMGSSTAYDLAHVGKSGAGPGMLGADDRGTKVSVVLREYAG